MVYGQNCLATFKKKDSTMGFIKGHIYAVLVEEARHGVELSVYTDTTMNHSFTKENIPYSNEKSMMEFWEF